MARCSNRRVRDGVAILIAEISMVLIFSEIHAQYSFPSMGSRSAGMGGCTTALTDIASSLNNVAGLVNLESAGVGVSVRNTAWLKQLNYGEIFVASPFFSNGGVAFSYDQFGSSVYHEERLSMAYAMRLMKRVLSLGVRLEYLHSATEDVFYPAQNMLSFSVGALVNLPSGWTLGMRCSNPLAWGQEQGIDIPTLYNIGVSCGLHEGLRGTAELEYSQQLRVRGGIEYGWNETFFARLGWASNPDLFTFGFGYRQTHLLLDMAVQMQHSIGVTPCLSLIYLF